MKPTKAKMPTTPLIPNVAKDPTELGELIPNNVRRVLTAPTRIKLVPAMPKVLFV